ncbi:MAG: transcriptional regulator [Alphaproteobacteria bacterium]|nr:transcriptional regulator [Alphaproteobacteria bacterium]|tara:strand:- start:25473 stop:25913 length:441 start_codon:yes stop_codon:yes gene_type:complete
MTIKELLTESEKYCADHGLRLTEPRQHVLQILLDADKPLGAYEILQELGAYIDNPKPPTAYRAIEFWQEHGFVHRIESLNAYTACSAGHSHSGSQYLVCELCKDVQEIHLCSVPPALAKAMQDKGFSMKFWNAEIHGLCANCSGGR